MTSRIELTVAGQLSMVRQVAERLTARGAKLPRRYKLIMIRICAIALTFVVCFVGSAVSADVLLFKGDPLFSTGMTVGGWGSGTAVEASDKVFTGSRCIKVNAQGMHEGGCINFMEPIELITGPVDNNDYLQFVLGFTTMIREGAGLTGLPGYGPTTMGPGMPGGSSRYYSGGQEFDVPSRPKVNKVRVVLESAEGRAVEATADVPTTKDEGWEGWYRVSIPLKVLGLKEGDSFKVTRVLIFTDMPDTIFVGQIGTTRDDTPITVYAGEDQVVAVYDTVTLRAEAEGGASLLRYSWNFGDRDPNGEDASGIMVNHKFSKGGDFIVRLTVSDAWGIKKPVVETIKITVND